MSWVFRKEIPLPETNRMLLGIINLDIQTNFFQRFCYNLSDNVSIDSLLARNVFQEQCLPPHFFHHKLLGCSWLENAYSKKIFPIFNTKFSREYRLYFFNQCLSQWLFTLFCFLDILFWLFVIEFWYLKKVKCICVWWFWWKTLFASNQP